MNPYMSAPFQREGATATAATTTSSSAAVALGRTGHEQVAVITNVSTTHAAVAFGASDMAAADATGIIVPPNGLRVVRIGPAVTHFRAIQLSGTGNVYVEVGEGSVT